ncbi:hypothetical protein KI743_13245 [Vibrio sp. D420a]|uniref:hypothetical protein n=1 Tax=Vibrio sp. D420a TaxID=2836895 RepID=UPI002552FA35|nr:hypothetical protein [Vibrio sp. D420a]MDK9762971.1 hypothetical protein [Vibrio sp. D420a]
MSNIQYLHGWEKDLCLTLDSGRNCDFNRLLYLAVPSTKALQSGKFTPSAERDDFVIQLKTRFDEKISEGDSQETLLDLFQKTRHYLEWCDEQHCKAFNQASLEGYTKHLHQRTMRRETKNTHYASIRSGLTRVFNLLDLPTQWFHNVVSLPKNDSEPFEAYSQSDLKQLLPFLRALFKQTSAQFLATPKKHMEAHQASPTMSFHWQGQTYQLCGAVSKMMASATYLLSYYTYSNASVLFSLPRPNTVSTTTQDVWYTMPAFKRRAFKLIHIEMGKHTLDIPKYSMQFFDTLLAVSREIDNSDDSLLLQTCVFNKASPISSRLLVDFHSKWLAKHFSFIDQRGRKLRPVISRFRETGSQLTRHFQGDIAQNITLDNSESVRRRHYSTGNRHENQGMTQDAALLRQQQATDKSSAKDAQKALQIEVLTIELSQKADIPQLSRTPNGGSCADPFGEKSKKFNRKASQHKLSHGEKLACAELLECFGCPAQVIVQSVTDIWCLLSFKESIEESLYLHLDAHHYRQNFENTVQFIEANILPRLNKSIVKQAENRLNEEGRHPAWQEAESIIPLVKANKDISQ